MLAPLILCAVILREPGGVWLPAVTAAALLTFLGSVIGVLPDSIFGLRLDLALLILVGVCGVVSAIGARRSGRL